MNECQNTKQQEEEKMCGCFLNALTSFTNIIIWSQNRITNTNTNTNTKTNANTNTNTNNIAANITNRHRLRFLIVCIIYHLLGFSCNTAIWANQYSTQPPSVNIVSNTNEKFHCIHSTFILYDGYEFVFGTRLDLEYSSTKLTLMPLLLVNDLYECLNVCLNRPDCNGINYQQFTCQLITFQRNNGHLIKSNNLTSFGIYAEKICLTDLENSCQNRPWAFESIIGYQINYSAGIISNYDLREKIHYNIDTKQDCSELCLNELEFKCRSVLFNEISGKCALSNLDRNIIDNYYNERMESGIKFVPILDQNNKSIHYMENKCIKEPKNFCDFKKIPRYRIKLADLILTSVNSLSECREHCLSLPETRPCRSFDFDRSMGYCRLSHLTESSAVHIAPAYIQANDAITFEISTCYNVSVSCQAKSMKIHIETNKLFNGKIYAQSQPKKCVNDIRNQLHFDLSVPYTNVNFNHDQDWLQCDTRQPSSGRFANDIIIQHHDLVLTTKDLALGVFCKFDLLNSSIATVDLKIQGNISTEKLKGSAKLPELSLHLVDENGNDIDEVSVGDMLRVQIRMSDEDTYGIFVRNLIAKDHFNSANNFTLIDDKGCPVEMKMMREVRLLNENRKALESYLEAFTFTGGSLLVIQVEVETCLDRCKPVQCPIGIGRSYQPVETVTSYGRRRRRRSSINSYENESADSGDIISMTKLSKSLLIRKQMDAIDESLLLKQREHSLEKIEKHQSNERTPEPTLQPEINTGTSVNTSNIAIINNKTKFKQYFFDHHHHYQQQQQQQHYSAHPSGFGHHYSMPVILTKATTLAKQSNGADNVGKWQSGPNVAMVISGADSPILYRRIILANNNNNNNITGIGAATAGNKSLICFEPTHLLILCFLLCCIQGSLFSLVFFIIIKMKNVPHSKCHNNGHCSHRPKKVLPFED